MKKYIWDPRVAVKNLKEIGENIVLIIVMMLLCTCPATWL